MKPQEVVNTAIAGAMKTKLKTADGKQITKDLKVSPLATQRQMSENLMFSKTANTGSALKVWLSSASEDSDIEKRLTAQMVHKNASLHLNKTPNQLGL